MSSSVRLPARIAIAFLICGVSAAWAEDPASAAGARVTYAEAEAFAKRLESSITAGDPSFLSSAVDDSAMVDMAIAGLGATPQDRAGFLSGAQMGSRFASQLVEAGKAGATYRLIRVRKLDGAERPLFRSYSDEGFNYQELYLAKANGAVKIVDIYIYLSGERLTKTFRRGFLPLLADKNKGFVAKLVGSESDYVSDLPKILQMEKEIEEKRFDAALATYQTLRESVKKDKTTMILRVRASATAGGDAYLKAIDDFAKAFPGDPAELLISLDGLFLRGQFGEAKSGIDQLDKALGGDPYLDLLRASAEIGMKNPVNAKAFLSRLTNAEPTFLQPWYSLIDMSLSEKQFAETARLLNESGKRAGINWGNVPTAQAFAEFVKSPQYKLWNGSHGSPETKP